jgi:hypothetical protein
MASLVRVGMTLEELVVRARDDPAVAVALKRAEDAARAWWEDQPQRAMGAGGRLIAEARALDRIEAGGGSLAELEAALAGDGGPGTDSISG